MVVGVFMAQNSRVVPNNRGLAGATRRRPAAAGSQKPSTCNADVVGITGDGRKNEGRCSSSRQYGRRGVVLLHALPHVRALAPVGKGLLPRFPSRCCPSGTKGPPFSPGSGNRG
ncbi:hypothetical protein BDA96_03G042200 [Sorghum bicolor]|uniref:Uncharacterized protein n=1 Tax=Sorghum bicolor TaxID=4558 RepID=A0A921RAT8_SORBI|nr:hypothetical protein BDA96_07G018900 [Sorghum bicolor]KAG0536178.1 hypothetical protein BDA96_03G042200 [Sorghum bicolor]